MKMEKMSHSMSALKCISYCFYHLQICLWGLKLATTRGPELKACFSSIRQKFMCFDALLLTPSDSSASNDGLILISKCLEMLDQVDARLDSFYKSWTGPPPGANLHSSTCGICMEAFDLSHADIRAVCCPGRHVFHAECIMDLFVFFEISSSQNSVRCPYCRFKLLNA